MAGKRASRLHDINDLCIYLSKLINRLDRGEVTESKAGKLGYLVNILKNCLESGELEKRLTVLEKIVSQQPQQTQYQFDIFPKGKPALIEHERV